MIAAMQQMSIAVQPAHTENPKNCCSIHRNQEVSCDKLS